MADIPSKIPGRKPVNIIQKRKITPLHVMIIVISVLVAVASVFISNSMIGSRKSVLADQAREINGLNNRVIQQTNIQKAAVDIEAQQINGLNPERVERDNALLSELMHSVLQWNTYGTFMDAYDDLMSTCKLDDDSTFLQIFFPENIRNEGSRVNCIDTQGLSVSLDNLRIVTRYIDSQTYYYMMFVDWSAQSRNGFMAHTTTLILCGVDGEGNIGNLNAYVVADMD